jgi:(4-(4-[2-(gamma-L-glutamylamino)ethyl]phenoxymethyl)furan-2-yl)methanamine synthase
LKFQAGDPPQFVDLTCWRRSLVGPPINQCDDQSSHSKKSRVNWLAFDIGGANIKAADGRGYCISHPFALWKEPDRLADVLGGLFQRAPACDRVAVTMTGELADCFATKEEGVLHLLRSLEQSAGGRPISVYKIDGSLTVLDRALNQPALAAAANWHALARFAGRFQRVNAAVLIDIGSTTTDVIPLVDGLPQPAGWTDTERLLSGELVYTGVERSPVCAVLEYLPYRKQWCPVAQELFATTWDAYLTLSELPEEHENTNTADGRPATRDAARARLARCICADTATFDAADAVAAAEAVRRRQATKIAMAVNQVLSRLEKPIATALLSGRGEFLARRVAIDMHLPGGIVSLSEALGPELSRCAPAHALAVLAKEGVAA